MLIMSSQTDVCFVHVPDSTHYTKTHTFSVFPYYLFYNLFRKESKIMKKLKIGITCFLIAAMLSFGGAFAFAADYPDPDPEDEIVVPMDILPIEPWEPD